MPLYEYQCPRCGRFELIQKFSDAPLSACPTCGGEVQKLLSAPAIQFKGTGWYITDYARKTDGKGKGEGAKAEGKSEGAKPEGGKDTAASTSSGEAKASPPASSKGAGKDSGG